MSIDHYSCILKIAFRFVAIATYNGLPVTRENLGNDCATRCDAWQAGWQSACVGCARISFDATRGHISHAHRQQQPWPYTSARWPTRSIHSWTVEGYHHRDQEAGTRRGRQTDWQRRRRDKRGPSKVQPLDLARGRVNDSQLPRVNYCLAISTPLTYYLSPSLWLRLISYIRLLRSRGAYFYYQSTCQPFWSRFNRSVRSWLFHSSTFWTKVTTGVALRDAFPWTTSYWSFNWIFKASLGYRTQQNVATAFHTFVQWTVIYKFMLLMVNIGMR